ncbi:cob(I)yrinic acid a,c-diamide adenosyltransferase [Cylindrospermopsis curvispora]|uniref:Cob(I)yrinic acid a,c-diamide adenosyltransferase n=1 Tax=Cylindrospermopsis curvispora GIHE-G1 TaxID=2666332 RepID=A0A7H0EXF3_9CYAN|nr:cob(I)yrinic acid a,c-diamide adenosyltransferase [Cylindrospermopsis curvispora]QNP28469.1 cob(I)yrinic acid a,c-diamide adenosyltransferase [Cylindrospermopsis curvispora GIHE-G1]
MTRNGIGILTAQARSERLTGQIHVYDGAGKGKSQAALGVVLRSIGLGINTKSNCNRVLLLRFLKGPGRDYDEDGAIAALQRGFPHLIDQVRTGRAEYFGHDQITPFDRAEAARGWDVAKGALASDLYSVVVLDEINPVLDLGLLPVQEVVETLKSKPQELEIITTGRAAPQQLLDIADLHSEMKPHHHPQAAELLLDGIEIYTGSGKGKSTSALGKALKSIGRGINHPGSARVLIMQWLKGGTGYTEDAAIAALQQSYPDVVDHLRCGRDAIVWRNSRQHLDYVEAERGWEIAKTAIASGVYKTIILDELNPTVDLELLSVEPILQALLRKPKGTEIIITGRCQNQPAYFDLASIHSEVYCHKHYANRGIELKRGVDF